MTIEGRPTAALVIPARNKERHVAASIRSALAQDYTGPLQIVVSDQGSTDDTRAVCEAVLAEYAGPHATALLDCPDRTATGLAGLNAHLRWLHQAVDADVFLTLGADDLNEPARVRRVMQAFEETGAAYVGTHCLFRDPSGAQPDMITPAPAQSSFVDPESMFAQRIGGSCSSAWRRELFDEFPLIEDVIPDLWLPYFATCRAGFFVIAEPLAIYLKHADSGNAGLEGRLRASTDPTERLEIEERIWCDITRTLERIYFRAHSMPAWPQASHIGLCNGIIEHGLGWAAARAKLDEARAQ
jgi:glycosyltransferase involved in cell wall biosynthesis